MRETQKNPDEPRRIAIQTHLKPWSSVTTSINSDGICQTAACLPRIQMRAPRSMVPRMMLTIRWSSGAGEKLSFISGALGEEPDVREDRTSSQDQLHHWEDWEQPVWRGSPAGTCQSRAAW